MDSRYYIYAATLQLTNYVYYVYTLFSYIKYIIFGIITLLLIIMYCHVTFYYNIHLLNTLIKHTKVYVATSVILTSKGQRVSMTHGESFYLYASCIIKYHLT